MEYVQIRNISSRRMPMDNSAAIQKIVLIIRIGFGAATAILIVRSLVEAAAAAGRNNGHFPAI